MKQSRRFMLLVLVLLVFIYSSPQRIHTSVMPTTLTVSPSRVVVDAVNTTMPTSPITVKVAVANIAELYAWQIKLYFNATVLNLTASDISYPSDHVFANRYFVPLSAVLSSDERGAYVMFGASLQGDEQPFTGSGVLCQMNFAGVAQGFSTLRFSKPLGKDTILLDFNGELILLTVFDGGINSVMSINVSPTDTSLERYVAISGGINPAMKNVDVAIQFRLVSKAWGTLANVVTDQNGNFAYTWRPTKAGTYEVRASWPGDEDVNPSISRTETVTVKPLMNVVPIVIAALVITAIVLLYFVKVRKH